MIGKNLTKAKKSVTSFFVFLISVFGIQSSYADYYPTGIQQNVSEQTLIDNGWTKFYEQTYATDSRADYLLLRPSGMFVILTGKAVDSTTLPVLAAAPTRDVFTETVINTPQLINGTYWYNTPNQSMGFAPTNVINQNSADCYEANNFCGGVGNSPLRLSWHLSGGGGWRLGDVLMLNNSTAYLKQVWTWDGVSTAPAPAPAPQVRQTQNLSFSNSFYGSDKISDPTGEIRGMLDEINRKYGNLIK